jgi:hypothetical protein
MSLLQNSVSFDRLEPLALAVSQAKAELSLAKPRYLKVAAPKLKFWSSLRFSPILFYYISNCRHRQSVFSDSLEFSVDVSAIESSGFKPVC